MPQEEDREICRHFFLKEGEVNGKEDLVALTTAQDRYRAQVAGHHLNALATLGERDTVLALEEEVAESMIVDEGEPSVAQALVQGGSAQGEGAVDGGVEWGDPMAKVRALLGGSRRKLRITTVGDKVVLEPEPEKKAPVVEGLTMGK